MRPFLTTHALLPALSAGLLALAGCAGGQGARPADPFSQNLADRQEIQIQVRNFNFSDATVWALVRDGRRIRLGVVTGKSDEVFTLSWKFSEPMRMEFDLLADVRCVTEELVVDPGDILEMQISVDPASDSRCRR